MHNDFMPNISIEEFAAYLDGNLLPDGMERIEQVISSDPSLAAIKGLSDRVESDVVSFYEKNLQIPESIANLDFELPDIDNFNGVQNSFELEVANILAEPLISHHEDDSLASIEMGEQGDSQLSDNPLDNFSSNTDESLDSTDFSNIPEDY